MMNEWQTMILEDAIQINPPRNLPKATNAPYVAMEDLAPFQRKVEAIRTKEYKGSGSRFRNGDTLLARITPCLENGKTAFVSELPDGTIACGSTEFIVLSGREGLSDNLFVYYLARDPNFRMFAIQLMEGTSGRQRVPASALAGLNAELPPLLEQRAIAAILGTLDDKIELNHQMNQTLEAMARAIFKSWFVDFEPFLDQGMEESPLGPIPKGWRVVMLRDLCKVAIGGDWGHNEPFEGAAKATCLRGVDLEHLRKDGLADAPQRWFKKGSLDKRQLNDKDVLIAASGIGPLGRPLWAHPLLSTIFPLPVIYSNFCKRFTTPSPQRAVYVERILLNMRENYQIWEYATGTSVPNLDVHGLLKHLIVMPTEDLLTRFYDFVLFAYSKLYSSESHTLAAIRDTLLPKLLSGEIRVKDAEKFMGVKI